MPRREQTSSLRRLELSVGDSAGEFVEKQGRTKRSLVRNTLHNEFSRTQKKKWERIEKIVIRTYSKRDCYNSRLARKFRNKFSLRE